MSNNKHYLTTYAINKLHNENHNDINDNNISNKNQLDTSFSNVKPDD